MVKSWECMESVTLLQSLRAPWKLKDAEVMTTSSIGISIYPKDGDDIKAFIKKADEALYVAKSKGKIGMNYMIDRKLVHFFLFQVKENKILSYSEESASHSWDYWDPKIQDVLNWLPMK